MERIVSAAPARPAAEPRIQRFPLPLLAVLSYAAIRLLSLAVAAYLLPRGRFATLHYSLAHLIQSWDSGRYLKIAAHGYSYIPGNLRHDSLYAWFPGYPAAIDLIRWVPGLSEVQAAFAVMFAAGLAAAWGLARLGMLLTGDRRVSLLLAALWAVAPGSIALVMLYPEALFCALAVWSLAALVERRWLTAGLLAALAGTVHNTALALVAAIAVGAVPVLVAAARDRAPLSAWWRPAAAVLLAPLGLAGYWAYTAWSLHRLAGWFWMEHIMRNGFDWGRSVVHVAGRVIDDRPGTPTVPIILTLLVLAAAVLLTGWSLTQRIPWSLHAYTLVVVVTAIGTGPFYFGSKPRYLLPAMLLALPLARLLARAPIWVQIPLVAVLAILSTWFALFIMSVPWAP